MAFGNMQTICERIGKPFLFAGMQEKLNARIRKVYKHEDGLYHTSELGNAFAIVCGAATGKDAEFLAEKTEAAHPRIRALMAKMRRKK